MNILIILAIIFGLLFAVAYITRRRFGVLGLALSAGAMLSEMWTDAVTPLVQRAGVELFAPPLTTVVAAGLVLLPAVLLLFSGPTYGRGPQRLVGSAAFALLAAALILTPLGNALNFDPLSRSIFIFLDENKTFIITAGIAYALFDILTLKTPRHKHRNKEKE